MLDRFLRFWLVNKIRRGFYNWDEAQLRRHQQERLGKMLAYLSQRSPFYRKLRTDGWDGRFESLPLISKSDMIAHYDEINTVGLRQADLFEFAIQQERGEKTGLYQGRYSVGLSSGTSGSRLPTVLGPSERRQYGSLLFARSGIPETVRQPRVLFTLRVNNPAFMEIRFLGVTIIHSDYTRPVADIVKLIREQHLNVLAGPPSLLRMIARQRADIGHPIEAIISYAEVLDDLTRQQLEQAFNAPVTQIYQGAEGFIASTCRAGNLHLNEDVVYVEAFETTDSLNNAQRVVVTDLYRQALPFLRYQINDIIEINPQPCPCGSIFRRVGRIHGRADDIFHLQPVSTSESGLRHLFPDYITRSINQASPDILEFQAIQHSPEQIEIRLQLKPGAERSSIETAIQANLAYWADKVGGRLGELVFADAPPERNPNSLKLIRVVRRF